MAALKFVLATQTTFEISTHNRMRFSVVSEARSNDAFVFDLTATNRDIRRSRVFNKNVYSRRRSLFREESERERDGVRKTFDFSIEPEDLCIWFDFNEAPQVRSKFDLGSATKKFQTRNKRKSFFFLCISSTV